MWDSKPVRLYSVALRFSPPEEEDQSHHCAAKSDQPKNLLSCGESSCHRLTCLHLPVCCTHLMPAALHSTSAVGRSTAAAERAGENVRLRPTMQAASVFTTDFVTAFTDRVSTYCLASTSTRNAAPPEKLRTIRSARSRLYRRSAHHHRQRELTGCRGTADFLSWRRVQQWHPLSTRCFEALDACDTGGSSETEAARVRSPCN